MKYSREFGSPAWVVKSTDFVRFLDLTYQAEFFGEIWLYNNDLQVIADYDTFKALYLDRIATSLNAKVDAVKVLVNMEREGDVFGDSGTIPDATIRSHLLAIAETEGGAKRLETFYFGKMSSAEIPHYLREIPDPYTIVFYNHRDSVGLNPGVVMVRHNVFPFSAQGERERFAVVWQIRDQEDIQGRLRKAFQECFATEKNFSHVVVNKDTGLLELKSGWSKTTEGLRARRIKENCAGLSLGDSVDTAVIASQWSELSQLRDLLPCAYRTPLHSDYYEYCLVSSKAENRVKTVLLAVVGEGNIAAACRTWDVIEKWKPGNVILFGVAGGDPEDKSQNLGDIVIGEKIVGYEHGKLVDGKFGQRPTVHDSDLGLVVTAERVFASTEWTNFGGSYPGEEFKPPKIHRFAVASGSKLVADAEFFKQIRQLSHEKVHATEMEGDGVGYACRNNPNAPKLLLIKSIMDFSSSASRESDPVTRDKWKVYSSMTIAHMVHSILLEL